MGYSEALEAAGAKVIDYKEVGDYQGSWGAVCEFNGLKCLVVGSFGSCSGCDAFQAEFDFNGAPNLYRGVYTDGCYNEVTKERYDELTVDYTKRLADFAQSYLTTPFFKDDILRKLASLEDGGWFSGEEKELYDWALTHFEA